MDQLGDFVYDQLFAVGVQVYERVTVKKELVNSPGPTVFYLPVLKQLHSPRDGKPGALRYGFIGSPLPEAFTTQPIANPSWPRLGTGHITPVDPVTYESPGFSELCVGDMTDGRPIGPLAGGSLAGWCPS